MASVGANKRQDFLDRIGPSSVPTLEAAPPRHIIIRPGSSRFYFPFASLSHHLYGAGVAFSLALRGIEPRIDDQTASSKAARGVVDPHGGETMSVQDEAPKTRLSMRKMFRESFRTMSRTERLRVIGMYGSILLLHLAGFAVFIAFVLPAHYKLFGVGLSVTAYTLGLRHAFDADHISAIDNTTRKAMNERQDTDSPRPFGFGYFFSLGHSTIVIAIGVGIIIAAKTVLPAVTHSNSSLESFGGTFGTIVSASFLFLIGVLNLVILAGIIKVFRSMRRGEYNEAELERQLENRGFFYRFFGRWMKTVDKEWQMYPVGVVFGMGFDTATEVALLTATALAASEHIPWQAIIALPILFTAGMSLMDTTDGMFMNMAYGWAFFNPVRKVYYNLSITGLSVGICFFIGGIETLSLVPLEVHGVSQTSGFWGFMYNFNINTAGFVIVGMFVLTWIVALLVWRYGHIEEKWTARLHPSEGEANTPLSPTLANASE
jgi:nickel/cobalt transporter (NiCoT) family protein